MFTGIIEETGLVKTVRDRELTIQSGKVLEGTRLGDSMAVNGACLTVTRIGRDYFSVEVTPETLRRTNLGMLHSGERVNLERPLALGGRVGGHLVQGHIDAVGKIVSIASEEKALIVRYTAPPEIMRYVVEKGFIAVDGASLTVVDCDFSSFTVSVIPYTQQQTTLTSKRTGDSVNLEVDIIAKYVERLQKRDKPGITVDLLAQHGFL